MVTSDQPAPARLFWGDRRTPQQFEPEWRGYRIIDWIYFWSAFGIVGQWIGDRLADRLDECSAWLERHAFPPTGGSGVSAPPLASQLLRTQQNLVKFEHSNTMGMRRLRWYCARCDRYFPDETLAKAHGCKIHP